MSARKSERECTPQEKTWVMAYIETGSMSDAFRKAYPKSKLKGDALNSSAKKVFRRTPVRLLYDSLQAKHLKKHEVTIERIVAEYAKMGFSNMEDYVVRQPDGTARLDLSKVTREQMAAISEMTFETVLSSDPAALEAAGIEHDGEGPLPKVSVLKTKFKLHDKKGSLQDLGKHLGMFKADNEQAAKAAAEAAAAAMAASQTPRDIARAVLDIIRQAEVQGPES